MKRLFSAIAAAFLSLMLVTSCDVFTPRDFGDINVDPNKPSTAYTSYLFTLACNYIPWTVLGDATNGYDPWQQLWNGYLSESLNNQYGQLRTTTQYTRIGSIYLYALKNLDMIIKMNEDPEQVNLTNVANFGTASNQIAASKTLSAFYYMFLTDMIGPIVMSEAFKGKSDDIWKPKYDTQKQVYTQLDDMLNESYKQFNTEGSLNPAYDVVYAGDIEKWKKLNASLRMLLAIKLCDVDPATGKARFAKAYSDGGMTSVDDGFNFTYDDQHWNMLYYWTPASSGTGNIVPNFIIVEKMKELQDPRMFKYFDIEGYKGTRKESVFPRDEYSSFYGVPFGLSSNPEVSAFEDCCSSVNSKMLAMDATIPVIPAARVLLTEAEAALRGWISADAKTLYEAGISASFAQWGAEDVDDYIASSDVAYDASKGLEQIAIQRWIASYLSDGVEAWSDWRRLDIPKMPVGPAAISKGVTQYAYRMTFYTDTDVAYNKENVDAVLSDLSDGDKTTSRVWWDVADNTKSALTEEQCKPSIVIPPDWKEWLKGTMVYGFYYYGGSPLFENHAAVIYKDEAHPGKYKIAPYADNSELLLTYNETDESFTYSNQVGLYDGKPIRAYDWDADQGTDHADDPSYRGYYDSDEGAWLFMTIWRSQEAAGWKMLAYGYDAFVPED